MQYSEFQAQTSSEKITFAFLYACRRLMGWELHSGSIYKVTGLNLIVEAIEDSGTAYEAVGSIGAVTASKYYYDLENETLYLRTTGSDNPNGRFIVLRQKLCFANVPLTLPHDLSTVEEVFFEPLIKTTSQFGVAIDVISQQSEAIEGSGSLTLHNDFEFWRENFDRLVFDNQDCLIYSYNRELDSPSDAKLIFKGKVERKSYSDKQIVLTLKDQFSQLRDQIPLATLEELGERTGSDLANAKQRLVLGRVFGHRPTNLDQVLEGYPLTGTISVAFSGTTVTGSGTAFLSELAPDDEIVINDERYTVATVSSNTSLTITDEYADAAGASAVSALILPTRPKRYMNREWLVAGHALRQPATTVISGSTITRLYVDDTTDIYPGDELYVGTLGSGEVVRVEDIIGSNQVKLATSLAVIPPDGTEVLRPAVQNVRINDVRLVYYQDYTFNASTARLTLRDTAEANSGPIRQMSTSLTFTNGSRTVTGTDLQGSILPGYRVGVVGNASFFEVLSVESETQLTLTSAATFSATATGRYQALIFDPSSDVLTLDVLGKTEEGTTGGTLLKTAPAIVKSLLTDAGLSDFVDESSFSAAEELIYQHIGIVVPTTYNDTNALTFREVINRVNKSVFGALVQNNVFQFSYEFLSPSKPTSAAYFSEADVLNIEFSSTAENMVKTVMIKYQPREYDYVAKAATFSTHQKTSDISNYILKTGRERTIDTVLVSSGDGLVQASRWAFVLESSAGRVVFTTKLQGISVEVGDVIEVEHRKIFRRFGGAGNRRLMFVESVKKSGSVVEVEATDLSNTFNRVASINTLSTTYADSSENDRMYGGFITDQYGLIDNDSETSGTNLIW
jgi:hypothetical protein